MRCILTDNKPGCEKPLADRLLKELSDEGNQRVLWLVTGGSNIKLSVAIMDQLPEELTKKLAVGLTDERFGPTGHPDSNLQQLFSAGFKPKQATVVPVLTPGLPLDATKERYEELIHTTFDAADVVIAQFGIGPDGHIAGVLPDTPGVASKDLVVAYETPTFNRISLTLEAIKRIPIAYAFSFGEERHDALDKLCNKDIPLSDEPSQILKQVGESYVYNDQVGEAS